MWRSWNWDIHTALWVFWMIQFAVYETYTLIWFRGQELTAHLRPVFQTFDLVYFLAVGLWLWLGWHFLIDGLWSHQWGITP